MAYCPVCKQHFEDEVKHCPKDRVELVDELPFQTIDSPNTTWVEITSVGTEDEARLLQGFLETEGIPAQVESLKFTMEPVNLGQMSEIRVYVAAENESEAMRLLEERRHEYESLRDDESVVTDEGPAEIDETAESVAEGNERD